MSIHGDKQWPWQESLAEPNKAADTEGARGALGLSGLSGWVLREPPGWICLQFPMTMRNLTPQNALFTQITFLANANLRAHIR